MFVVKHCYSRVRPHSSVHCSLFIMPQGTVVAFIVYYTTRDCGCVHCFLYFSFHNEFHFVFDVKPCYNRGQIARLYSLFIIPQWTVAVFIVHYTKRDWLCLLVIIPQGTVAVFIVH